MLGVIFLLCFLTMSPSNTPVGQTAPVNTSRPELIEQLLGFPAPAPASSESREQAGIPRFTRNSPPPDDAPLEVLALYWGQIDDSVKKTAQPKTRERLVEACVQKPEATPALLKL